ncbi:hypothetical protein [Salegentibacter sediminis]|uniref:hypothetical protein n=1 Tax=Salegentibacter sediminis TaxID=1930251 RepID=UPI0012FF87D5|nr:hypothetical protein [Salegentibacter sediminis]
MKFKLTSRDFKFFILGLLAAFAFSTIYNWEENVESFKKGYADGRQDYELSREK